MNESSKDKIKLEFYGGKITSLIPVIIFIASMIYVNLIIGSMDWQSSAAICCTGLAIGSLLCKKQGDYWKVVLGGMTDPGGMYVCIMLFLVSIFAYIIRYCNLTSGFVWLGDTLGVTGGAFVVFAFIATAAVSSATGSSFAAMFTAFPVLYPAGVLLNCQPAILAGAIYCGAHFGDNLAPVSDTTILSATTQHYRGSSKTAEIPACVATRCKYCIVAGIIALIYYFICGGGAPDIVVKEGAVAMDNYDPLPLIMLIPVALVIYIAFVKRDVYIAASIGIVVSTAVGLVSGLISVSDIVSFQEGTASGFIVDGFNGMVSIVLVILIMFGVSAIMHASGIFEAMINKVTGGAMCKTTRRTEFTLAWLMTGVSALMGCGQDPALVMLGPVYDEIGQRTGIHPYRRAEIIDAMSTMLPACIPFTCIYLFMISNMTQGYDFVAPLSTFDLLPGCAYCFILFCVIQLSILTGWGRLYEGPNGEPLKADGTVLKNLWSFNNISPSRPCGK